MNESNAPAKADRQKSVIEDFGALIPLFAAAMLVASVAYDFAFLFALGLGLDEIPSTLSEHIRSAVAWAPKVVIAFILYATVELFLRKVEGFRTEAELIASSPTPKVTRGLRRSGDWAMLGGALLAALLGPFFSSDGGWVFFTFMVLWGTLTLTVLSHPKTKEWFGTLVRRSILVTPILIAIICMQGHAAAAAMKQADKPTWEVSVKDGDKWSVHKMLGVRRFSTFAVAVTPERTVWLIPSEAIGFARTLQPLDTKTLNVCRWFEIGCSPATKK